MITSAAAGIVLGTGLALMRLSSIRWLEMGFARSVADRVVFMDHGEIVEDTNKSDFFTQPKIAVLFDGPTSALDPEMIMEVDRSRERRNDHDGRNSSATAGDGRQREKLVRRHWQAAPRKDRFRLARFYLIDKITDPDMGSVTPNPPSSSTRVWRKLSSVAIMCGRAAASASMLSHSAMMQ